jgi:hypothetical protein
MVAPASFARLPVVSHARVMQLALGPRSTRSRRRGFLCYPDVRREERGSSAELARLDTTQARVVELRSFAGLEVIEVAAHLGIPRTTVEREWPTARVRLGRRLERGHAP